MTRTYTNLSTSTVNSILRAAESHIDSMDWIEDALDHDNRDMANSEGLLARTVLKMLDRGCTILDIRSSELKPTNSHAARELAMNGALVSFYIDAEKDGIQGIVKVTARNNVGGSIGISAGFPLNG